MESIEGAAARRPDPRLERIQIEHELQRAYVAAHVLHERLELAGLDDLASRAKRIQEEIAQAFHRVLRDDIETIVDQVGDKVRADDRTVGQKRDKPIVARSPCQAFSTEAPIEV